MSKSTSFSSEWMSFWSFWSLKSTKLLVKVSLYFSNAKKSEKMQIFAYTFNSKKACFVALEQRRSTRNDTFSWFWPRIPKIKKKIEKSKWFVLERSTPLNRSAFGVTLDSSVKSRPVQQTKSTSPGRLQFGMIICYDKIKRYVTGQCSAYHKMVVLDLVWTTDPGNRSAVRNGEEAFKTGENMGGAVQWSVAQKFNW